MDKLEELSKLMASRIAFLTREATKLSRMAGASVCHRERRYLRDKSRELRNKAKLMQSRLDKLNIEPNNENEGVVRHA